MINSSHFQASYLVGVIPLTIDSFSVPLNLESSKSLGPIFVPITIHTLKATIARFGDIINHTVD
jgi:hypothetical protein